MGVEDRNAIRLEELLHPEKRAYVNIYFTTRLKEAGEKIEDSTLLENTEVLEPIYNIIKEDGRGAKNVINQGLTITGEELKRRGIKEPTYGDLRRTSLESFTNAGVTRGLGGITREIFTPETKTNATEIPITLLDILRESQGKTFNKKTADTIIELVNTQNMSGSIPLKLLRTTKQYIENPKYGRLLITETVFPQVISWTNMRIAKNNFNFGHITAAIHATEELLQGQDVIEELQDQDAITDIPDSLPTIGMLRELPFRDLLKIGTPGAAFLLYLFKGDAEIPLDW